MEQFKIGAENRVRKDTVTKQVYDIIRGAIMELKLKPGSMLSEKEISMDLGVSRTPVRESFIRLEREGLVNIYPQRGTYISKISISRCKEERFLRDTLEAATFDLYMKNHPSLESMDEIMACIEEQRKAIADKNYLNYLALDDKLHNVFYDATGNVLCKEVVRYSLVNYQRLRLLTQSSDEAMSEQTTEQHEQIYDAIVSRDVEAAEAVYKTHLDRVFVDFDKICAEHSDYFID